MNKTMSMGLNQCLTKYPCSGHVKQKSLTLKINELGFFLAQKSPCRVNHVSSEVLALLLILFLEMALQTPSGRVSQTLCLFS